MGVYTELRGFVLAHRSCGVPRGDADPEPGDTASRIKRWTERKV